MPTKSFKSMELGGRAPLKRRNNNFSLRSLPLRRAEIHERLSSSLLPPSFAGGRFATLLFPAGATRHGPASSTPLTSGAARPEV